MTDLQKSALNLICSSLGIPKILNGHYDLRLSQQRRLVASELRFTDLFTAAGLHVAQENPTFCITTKQSLVIGTQMNDICTLVVWAEGVAGFSTAIIDPVADMSDRWHAANILRRWAIERFSFCCRRENGQHEYAAAQTKKEFFAHSAVLPLW